ncbi:MAG: response regulator [Pirellulaceae bacterium]
MQGLGSILFVDDEETFRESTCRLLRREGFDCHGAADADEGLSILQANRFDLLVADIRMPANPELRIVRAARELDHTMPVILMTGYPSMETAIHSVELSVAAYLTKPLKWAEFLEHVKRAIAHSRSRQALTAIRGRLQSCIIDLEGAQSKPISRTGVQDEPVLQGTIRTLAVCLSELLALCPQSDVDGYAPDLCELLDCPQRPVCRDAIVKTIAVLKKTKDTFKSKELAELRMKLEDRLGSR